MNDVIGNAVSVTTIYHALQHLLEGYQREKEESQRDDDTLFIQYWDSACQTIYDVAAALNIPFEEEETPTKPRPYKQRPYQPNGTTGLPSDAQLPIQS